MPRRMIVVTNLDVWMLTSDMKKPGMGNQSLYNTLLGYARAGYQVHMVTTSTCLAEMPPIHENVVIHRMPIRTYEWYRCVRGGVRRLLRPRPAGPGPAPADGAPPDREPRGVTRFAPIFRRVMGRRVVALARRLGGVDLVYGYEILGAHTGEFAAKRLGVPLVTRFQGTELCRYLDRPELLDRFPTWAGALKVDADLIIMANDGTQGDQVLDVLGVPGQKVRFYMNGVVKEDVCRPDVDVAGIRGQLGLADKEVFVFYAGRLFHWKRIDRMLRVMDLARKRFDRFRLVLAGDGPERGPCRRLADELQLGRYVMFLGPMPHSQVMDYLNACDVYVSFYDLSNLSNSLIESCVCGKCIVTTAAGGTTHLLTDGVNGRVVARHDDEPAIADALVGVLADPAERARLAEGALRRGRELKTWAERMEMEVGEVERVLAPRPQAPQEGRSRCFPDRTTVKSD
ncbi:MAG TPA: glycosyltransferase family 4 protein [Phycisphaerae bacterium]|nr:glycosyltransferase family 4 protein [Phycisphaerae bacterium]